jgi:hypothetical protein
MGPPDTPSVGWRRPLGASVKPLRYPALKSQKAKWAQFWAYSILGS